METSLYQGVLAFTTQLWQHVEHPGPNFWGIPMDPQMGVFECADGRWVHSMHNSGGRGKDRSKLFEILGIEPFEIVMGQDAAEMARQQAVVRAAVARIPRDELLAAFWANDFAVAPVLRDLRAETGLSSALAGLLTTLPVLCFGAFAPAAPRLARRIGLETAVALSLLLLAAGIALRLLSPLALLFAGSLFAGAAIAFANVLLPAYVKREYARPGVVMGVYSASLNIGSCTATSAPRSRRACTRGKTPENAVSLTPPR